MLFKLKVIYFCGQLNFDLFLSRKVFWMITMLFKLNSSCTSKHNVQKSVIINYYNFLSD